MAIQRKTAAPVPARLVAAHDPRLRIVKLYPLMLDPLAILIALAGVILLSALSGWLAYRTAGLYGFTKGETRWWLSLALLLGPAGLLTLLCLRAWPVRQICHACGKLRPADRALCVNCESAAEAPPRDGTEILVAS